jgi:hypothetical protein
MAFSLAKNFLDTFYSPLIQKACENVPQTDRIILVFLDSTKSSFGTVELVDFLRSEFINSEFFQCSKFYFSEDYIFRDSSFSKDTPFWILYFETSKPVSMTEFSFYILTRLQGVKFHLPLNFRNDSEVNLKESKREFIKTMQSYRNINLTTIHVEESIAKLC